MSERASEMAAILGTLDPTSSAASGTFTFEDIDASKYDSVVFVVQTGSACSSGTNTMTITGYEGTSTGSVTTSITSSSHALEANAQYVLDIDMADLSGPNYRYVTAKAVTNDVADVSGVALGFKPRYHPASDGDLTSVQFIKQS